LVCAGLAEGGLRVPVSGGVKKQGDRRPPLHRKSLYALSGSIFLPLVAIIFDRNRNTLRYHQNLVCWPNILAPP